MVELREIPDAPGYAITPDGQVWSRPKEWTVGYGSLLKHDGRWLTPLIQRAGYPYVRLRMGGKYRSMLVHRLVALTWIPNDAPKVKTEVNHLNSNRADPRAVNLEWCTRSENHKHAYHSGRRPPTPALFASRSKMGTARRKLTDAQVADIRKARNNGTNQSELARIYGVSPAAISLIVNRKTYQKEIAT